MPRQIIEELQGYRFGVGKREVPVTDESGNPIFNGGSSGPKMREETVVELVDLQPTQVHVIRIPLTDDARDELVRQLTGGIQVARQMPHGGVSL